jgi:hypothetical protein
MARDKVSGARRGSSRDRPDIVRLAAWRRAMVSRCSKTWWGGSRLRSSSFRQVLQWHVNIGDGSTECVGILRRVGAHILRARPGQFVNLADVTARTCQDGGDDLRHILSVDRRRSPGAEGQPDRRVPADRFFTASSAVTASSHLFQVSYFSETQRLRFFSCSRQNFPINAGNGGPEGLDLWSSCYGN